MKKHFPIRKVLFCANVHSVLCYTKGGVKMDIVKLSVRKLVEFLMKTGDIDTRLAGADRAQMGTKVHQELQNAAGENYEKEVPLQIEYVYEDILFKVEGRADGIINQKVIDEIKSTYTPLGGIPNDGYPIHWAQVICYGYFYAKKEELTTVTLQLTYYHLSEKETSRFTRRMTFLEMETFFHNLIKEYANWVKLQLAFSKKRTDSLKKLQFPFETYRKGQRELAIAVYRTIYNGDTLFCEAPTGIGKTISGLFPTLKAMSENKIDKIFYLTAKTITRQVAEDAMDELRRQKINLRAVTITAKDKICFLDERRCEPDFCQYAKGYYNRINDCLFDLMRHEQTISREILEAYGKKYTVCPFELSLDVALFCDMIICDYNYLFDPKVYLRRFFIESKENFAFLIDEAHNLVDRSKMMYSATLSKALVLQVKKSINKNDINLYQAVSRLNNELIKFRKLCDRDTKTLVQNEAAEDLNAIVTEFVEIAKEWLPQNAEKENQSLVLELFFEASHYERIAGFYGDNYSTLIETGKDTKITQVCIDPSSLLREKLNFGRASILFSATLSPLNYYSELLGGEKDTSKLSFRSPFPEKNVKIISPTYIHTRYQERPSSYEKIIECIHMMMEAKSGNYLLFFPSYSYMEEVYHRFIEQYPNINVIKQSRNMDEEVREAFLKEFQVDQKIIGFAILGGIFSEGVDLKGTRLIGAGIIGVGLAEPSLSQNLMREYYDQKANRGFYYAYQIPGLNKVLQAAGRVIRSSTDKGVILLMDSRFQETRYRNELPAHWRNLMFVRNSKQLAEELSTFWQKQEEIND